MTQSHSSKEQSFIAGLAYAMATLNKLHNQPSMCADVLQQSGFKLKHFRGVDEFDRLEIRRIWRTEKSRWKR